MEKYQIEANERFFDNLLFVLRDGGKWGWPDTGLIFTKTGGKLTGDQAGLDQVKKIVSEKYFEKNFGIKK